MSYKALLFCPDEKTARTVTQVLSELEFQVESCPEAFAAVKKLMTGHFDAVVVDCENEQNATLLFKSARNSESNEASLAVAVVEGQSGVAKAFRIGANLVLTKPINVEQSKSTLRVARGLLRKTEVTKSVAISKPGPSASSALMNADSQLGFTRGSAAKLPPKFTPPSPKPTAAARASAFDLEEEPTPKPEAAEAALLESMPDPFSGKSQKTEPPSATMGRKPYPWQPISKPMATALQHASEATGKSDASVAGHKVGSASSIVASSAGRSQMGWGQGAAAAPAPAKQTPPDAEDLFQESSDFLTSAEEPTPSHSTPTSGGGKTVLIAAIVLVAAVGGYVAWSKLRGGVQFSARQPAAPAQSVASPSITPSQSVQQDAALNSQAQPTSSEIITMPRSPAAEKSSATTSVPAASSKKNAATNIEVASNAGVKSVTESDAPEALVVKSGTPKTLPPTQTQEEEPTAPGALSVAPDSSEQAISGLVSAPTSLPHAAPQTLRVSQGVSQGLLVKKVSPVYPQQALNMKIQGSVQILANIGKDGDIINVKVLSGDSLLARSALEAVKQWKYKPYYLNGQPVEIQTQITVNFRLP